MRRIVEGVLRDGKPFAAREHRFLIDPHGTGALQEAYFDFVCQPLREDGTVVGVSRLPSTSRARSRRASAWSWRRRSCGAPSMRATTSCRWRRTS